MWVPSGAVTGVSGLILVLVIRFSAVKHDLMRVGEIILEGLLEDAYVRIHEADIIRECVAQSEQHKLPKKKPASVNMVVSKPKKKRK